ncbi:transmembrane protein 169-like [Acanthaster planci]|uniref:Transmembrane protein 169-like n=1 Tax=Acanthaster planci TaxID=133434 RepID=A0A8B7XLR9_ACAPL|nr:transmembrane protein 169-like [Acanthaster planci]XP_022081758.1 transmembrane protein 169-like [Acanthaster planci]
MPKTPFRKHVKFVSIDNNGANGPENAVRDGQVSAQSQRTESPIGGGPSSFQTEEITEIRVEDEDGVSQPHRFHPDHAREHCSECHMLGKPHKHQRVTATDQDDDDEDGCIYSPQQGPHIIILTFLCIPFVFATALVVNTYLGILTWYNIFLYYYDDRGWIHRIVVCPVLILLCPPVILVTALVVSLYSSVRQLSWYLSSWRTSVTDLEKGFYAWLCHQLGLPNCSPYEVITLDDYEEDSFGRTTSCTHASSGWKKSKALT